jgi:hypothetical protein
MPESAVSPAIQSHLCELPLYLLRQISYHTLGPQAYFLLQLQLEDHRRPQAEQARPFPLNLVI